MAICKCSENCEHYVSPTSKTGLHRNCASRINRWKYKKEVHEVLEYARKLDVRRGTLSFIVSRTDVARTAIEKRKEVAEYERKEREKAERKRRSKRRLKAKGRVDARKTRRAVRPHERKRAGKGEGRAAA